MTSRGGRATIIEPSNVKRGIRRLNPGEIAERPNLPTKLSGAYGAPGRQGVSAKQLTIQRKDIKELIEEDLENQRKERAEAAKAEATKAKKLAEEKVRKARAESSTESDTSSGRESSGHETDAESDYGSNGPSRSPSPSSSSTGNEESPRESSPKQVKKVTPPRPPKEVIKPVVKVTKTRTPSPSPTESETESEIEEIIEEIIEETTEDVTTEQPKRKLFGSEALARQGARVILMGRSYHGPDPRVHGWFTSRAHQLLAYWLEQVSLAGRFTTLFRLLKWLLLLLLAVLMLIMSLTSLRHADLANMPRSLGALSQRIREMAPYILSPSSWGLGHYPPIDVDGSSYGKSINDLRSSVFSELKNLKDRVGSVESSLKGISTSTKTPSYKVNFFSIGSGVLVDPLKSSPTLHLPGRPLHSRAYHWLMGVPNFLPNPHSAVFAPWEDVGDCWCAPGENGRSQLAIMLTRKISPTELVVEHIPKDSTLYPERAPRGIELWGQILNDTIRESVAVSSFQHFPQPGQPGYEDYMATTTGRPRRKDPVNMQLDKTWLQLGRWEYDINAPHHVQGFHVPFSLRDHGAAIDKVIFRTQGNWGAHDRVCLYRLKLHGHVAQSK